MLEFGKKLPGKNYTSRPGAYVVIINNNNQIGVVINQDGYCLVGGGIETNEALHREAREEVGAKIYKVEKIGEATEHFFAEKQNEYYSKKGHFYKARLKKIIAEPTVQGDFPDKDREECLPFEFRILFVLY